MSDDEFYDSDEDFEVIAVCNGGGMIQAGFAGDDAPRAVFPSVVGRPKHAGVIGGQKDSYVGDEAQSKRGILSMTYPIKHGEILDIDNMEKIWHHTFYNELRIAPEEHAILQIFKPQLDTYTKYDITEVMFETFNTDALHLMSDSTTIMTSSGRSDGLVVDMGIDMINVVAITDYVPIMHSLRTSYVGGKDITNYLQKLLTESGFSFTTTAELEIVQDMKEKMCFVAEDEVASSELETLSKSYETPDGSVITVVKERFKSTEPIFMPQKIGQNNVGVVDLILDSLATLDDSTDYLQNIILAGGTSMFPGLAEKIASELKTKLGTEKKVKVIAPPERKCSAWIGASIHGSLSAFPVKVIQKAEYEEFGPRIVKYKCYQ